MNPYIFSPIEEQAKVRLSDPVVHEAAGGLAVYRVGPLENLDHIYVYDHRRFPVALASYGYDWSDPRRDEFVRAVNSPARVKVELRSEPTGCRVYVDLFEPAGEEPQYVLWAAEFPYCPGQGIEVRLVSEARWMLDLVTVEKYGTALVSVIALTSDQKKLHVRTWKQSGRAGKIDEIVHHVAGTYCVEAISAVCAIAGKS